uniref:Putative secreted peptide n=1 Tax=Anopheles braziliensis TaxID=58242 RepID=A0A2M3ZW83_9DIPT
MCVCVCFTCVFCSSSGRSLSTYHQQQLCGSYCTVIGRSCLRSVFYKCAFTYSSFGLYILFYERFLGEFWTTSIGCLDFGCHPDICYHLLL